MTGEVGTTQGNRQSVPEAGIGKEWAWCMDWTRHNSLNSMVGEAWPWWMEWARHDSLDSIAWAVSFIWAGVVILAYSLGVPFQIPVAEQAWSLFFLGAGAFVLIKVLVRVLVPAYRTSVTGELIWAGILFAIGTGSLAVIVPLILFAIGASILRDLLRKSESQ